MWKATSILAAAFIVLISSAASATKLQLIPNVSGSAVQFFYNNAVGGKFARITITSGTLVLDSDNNLIYSCNASLVFALLNGNYLRTESNSATCFVVQAAPASGPITSFNIIAPYFDPGQGNAPTATRPAAFWEISKDTDVEVCLQVVGGSAPGAPFPHSRLFDRIYCQTAVVDSTKSTPADEDPLFELGGTPLNP